MVKKKNIFATKGVEDLINILRQSALNKQYNTEKKLRELFEHLDANTFMVLAKIMSEYALKWNKSLKK